MYSILQGAWRQVLPLGFPMQQEEDELMMVVECRWLAITTAMPALQRAK
jgi:hypothetical protein